VIVYTNHLTTATTPYRQYEIQKGVRTMKHIPILPVIILVVFFTGFPGCQRDHDEHRATIEQLGEKGLRAEIISAEDFHRGIEPADFFERTGAPYKPSYNEDPAIPPQCWIETGYGMQNACQYCHTDYLASIEHGNAFPIADDQILYSFPTENLNRILWQNIIYPEQIEQRLRDEGIAVPSLEDTDYVRVDNWRPAFERSRENGNTNWMNTDNPGDTFALFPALDPNHLFPYSTEDPTNSGTHGYIDREGFVRNEQEEYTGWRAINFFPYGIFTPLTGSVSGIYIRLPESFMTMNGEIDIYVYKQNLDLLERQIKNRSFDETRYYGDASTVPVQKGFYPVSTEFAHPLHYVDLLADGETGPDPDGVRGLTGKSYEFPGTRSKRVKEIRYMYKWKEVTLSDIADDEDEEDIHHGDEYEEIIGREGQGWVENGAGWILSAFIEDRGGNLRPQTTEELVQCIGCHANVGNTVDAVWSFQRKLPGGLGWREMDYGRYNAQQRERTRLNDYMRTDSEFGELGYFYYTVVGADLYGVMPAEIRDELQRYTRQSDLRRRLGLQHTIDSIFDDGALSTMGKDDRMSRLRERQNIMRHYTANGEYLYFDRADDAYYIKGNIFYPTEETMKRNIQLYRKIVLDQSYNLGKDVFGTEPEHVPFTFRSDGTVIDAEGNVIPVGEVITSRPFDEHGEGITPTGIVAVNEEGIPVDADGNPVDVDEEPERAVGHISTGGTFDMMYNPIISDRPIRK
jgi:hypothetical protein